MEWVVMYDDMHKKQQEDMQSFRRSNPCIPLLEELCYQWPT
jgi:hypothetical protein